MASLRFRSSRGRRGFTFIELLIAASITAMTLAAGATMISAVSNATLETKDTRQVKKAGQMTASRLSSWIRQARCIGEVSGKGVILWDVDLNGDEIVNLHETSMLIYFSDTNRLARRITTPATAGDAGPALSPAAFENSVVWATTAAGHSPRDILLADNVIDFAFSGFPDNTETRIVNFRFLLNTATDQLEFREAASPRATADYLFNNNTNEASDTAGEPSRRTEYSRWTGWADVNGTPEPYP